MSLQLSFNICQTSDCKKLQFSDLTGSYNCNGVGFGGSNPEISGVTSATLNITFPNTEAVLSIDLLEAGFPTTNPALKHIIYSSPEFIITDGFYIFEYIVVIDGVEYISKKYKLLHCEVDCCLSKMKAKIAERSCRKSPEVDNLILAEVMLEAAKDSTKCNNPIRATKLLNTVKKICSINSCGC
jgi:hypothetical protein